MWINVGKYHRSIYDRLISNTSNLYDHWYNIITTPIIVKTEMNEWFSVQNLVFGTENFNLLRAKASQISPVFSAKNSLQKDNIKSH